MNEKLKENILQGKYKEAEKICEKQDINQISDTLISISYDTESICIYSFIRYMIQKTKKEEWIKIAIDVMLHSLCFIEGAYSVALFHARELLAIERTAENLERILFFYNIPEKLIQIEEALCIANEILEIDANNMIAQNILERL